VTFGSHGSSHLTPPFDRICAGNNDIIPLLDVGRFVILRRAYGRFVSDLAHVGYNQIDQFDSLADYQRARLEAFQLNSIDNSFMATCLVPSVDAEKVLLKPTTSLRTPTPVSSRSSSRSSQFTPKMARSIFQVQEQASMLKDLLYRWSNSLSEPN
jgi:hypothetical protein